MDTLGDWGEFRLINEVIIPALERARGEVVLGDDCAAIRLPKSSQSLVVTTDVAPKPLVFTLGYESYRTWGWYAVLSNASDLASAAAEPLAFTTSVEAPATTPVPQFADFFAGVAEACDAFKLPNAGGNIRSAPRFACHGTAMGTATDVVPLTRRGCVPGDVLFSVGECGLFIAAYLAARRQGGVDNVTEWERQRLLFPRPRLSEMRILVRCNGIHAASDNSDGVLGSLWNIAERSKCAIEVDMNDSRVPEAIMRAATLEGINPWNLMMFWGDWQVVVAVAPAALASFQGLAEQHSIPLFMIGRAIPGEPALYCRQDSVRHPLMLLRNENFVTDSFNMNTVGHVEYLLKTRLIHEG